MQELNFKRYVIASLYGRRVIKGDLKREISGVFKGTFTAFVFRKGRKPRSVYYER